MSVRRITVMLAVVGALVAGCDDQRRAISRDDLPEVSTEPDHVVVLDDGGFDVEALEVDVTDLVEFRVEGDEQRGIRTDDHEIDTGLLLPGESTYVVFDEAKRYELVDLADADHQLVVESAEPG